MVRDANVVREAKCTSDYVQASHKCKKRLIVRCSSVGNRHKSRIDALFETIHARTTKTLGWRLINIDQRANEGRVTRLSLALIT